MGIQVDLNVAAEMDRELSDDENAGGRYLVEPSCTFQIDDLIAGGPTYTLPEPREFTFIRM